MKKLLILCLFALSTSVNAKSSKWYEGTVVLNDEKMLVGEISLEPTNDFISLRAGGTVVMYAANKIHSFYFFDAEQSTNRKFLSLKDVDPTKNKNHFYEVVLRGKVNILRQQKPGVEQEANTNFANFNYYVRMDNRLTNLSEFRKHIFPLLLQSRNDQIITFIYQNKLNPNSPDNAIKIIDFYNRQEGLNTFATNK